jgi:transcriptional regulator with XRE-family HTH domain
MTDISSKKTKMKIGQEIKKLRLDRGMTQEELAERTNLSTRTIQRIENGEVDPRAYTLQTLASALEVEFELLNSIRDEELDPVIARQRDFWLPMLHLSGIFVFLIPPLIIWLAKKDEIEEIRDKDEIEEIRDHGVDVINFQISMWAILIPCGIFAFLLITIPIIIFIGIYSMIIILVNTVRVVNHQPYKYWTFLKVLKK